MKQVLFRFPGLGITLYGFGFMLAVAFYVATLLAAWRSRREKLDPDVIYDLAFWIVIGATIGARLFYVVEYWGETINTLADAFRVWEGGIVFYGGAAGGAVAFFLRRAFRTFPVLATLDAMAPSVALGIALGRIGCFLNGCCYGDLCPIPWLGVRFPRNSPPWLAQQAQRLIPLDAFLSLPVHPTQIYSALNGLVLLMLLTAYYPLRRRDGEVIVLLVLTYPVTRFIIEFLRDDEATLPFGLTIAQKVSVFLFGAGIIFWSRLARRPAMRHADQPAPAEARV